MNHELKGICNGAMSKSGCAMAKVTETNLQSLNLPVVDNGFALLGYKTGDIELYENTYIVIDLDGYVDYESDFVRNMASRTLTVGTGSHGLHAYICVLGKHDLPKHMDCGISQKVLESLGESKVVHIDVLTKEKVFAAGCLFTIFPADKVAHTQGYEILGTDEIIKMSLESYTALIGDIAIFKEDMVIEFNVSEPNVLRLEGYSKIKKGFRDIIEGIFKIPNIKNMPKNVTGKIEMSYWKLLYREFYAHTKVDPHVLAEYFEAFPLLQPEYQHNETYSKIPWIMEDKKSWGKQVAWKTYYEYFPEEKKVPGSTNEDKKQAKKEALIKELQRKQLAGEKYITLDEYNMEIDANNVLILNGVGLFSERTTIIDDISYTIRSARYIWESLEFSHFIVRFDTDDMERLYTFKLNGVEFHNKSFSEIVGILQSSYINENGNSIKGILNGYLCHLVDTKKIPNLTKSLRSYCGFHKEGWVLPQINESIITEESVGKQIKEALASINLNDDLEGAKKRFIDLYLACGWDTTLKDIVFSWYTVAPFLSAMRDYDTKLSPILSLFADGDLGKSTLTEKLIKAWGHMDGVLAANEASSQSRMQSMLCSSTFPVAIDDVQRFSEQHIDDLKSATTIGGCMRRKGAGKGGQFETLKRNFVAPICMNQNKYSNIFNDPQLRQRIIDLQINSLKKSIEWNQASREIQKGDLLKLVYAISKNWDVKKLMEIYDLEVSKNGLERDKKIYCILSIGRNIFENITGIELDFTAGDIDSMTKATRMINTSDITDIVMEYCNHALPHHLYLWQDLHSRVSYDKFYDNSYVKPNWVKTPIGIKKDKDGVFWYAIMAQNIGEILEKYGEKEKASLQNFYVKIKEGFADVSIFYDGKTTKIYNIVNYATMNHQAKCVLIRIPDEIQSINKYPDNPPNQEPEIDGKELARLINAKGGRF